MEVVQTFGDAVVDRCTLIERSSRVLENHLDIPLNPFLVFLGKFSVDLLSLEENFTVGCVIQADDCTGNRGLAGTGLTDECECLTLINLEVCVFYCFEYMFLGI